MMTQRLLDKYGPVMKPAHLGEIFHRKYGGIRYGLEKAKREMDMGRDPTDRFYGKLLRAKRRYGKNVYFETKAVAELLAST